MSVWPTRPSWSWVKFEPSIETSLGQGETNTPLLEGCSRQRSCPRGPLRFTSGFGPYFGSSWILRLRPCGWFWQEIHLRLCISSLWGTHLMGYSCTENGSTEAEYMAGTEEIICIKGLTDAVFTPAPYQIQWSITLRGDNQGSLALANNPQFHQRTKHIALRQRFISDMVDEGIIQVQYIICPHFEYACRFVYQGFARWSAHFPLGFPSHPSLHTLLTETRIRTSWSLSP